MWFIYILKCLDGSYYTGSTNNIEKRIKNHFGGHGAKYTKSHRPESLIYQEEFINKSDALKREAEIKKWPKPKKEKLVSKG